MVRVSFFIACFLQVVIVGAQVRTEIKIPDILGYKTLKCDFHMHTVFSDGDVWPTIRVQEAWEDGLDVISITDHIEYRPHSQDIKGNHNRSFEIAEPLAKQLGIILIRGAEITRGMPPGHLNAIFIKNANLLERETWIEACKEAQAQGAFVFWDHPGWKVQQPNITKWWPEHTALLDEGILKGVEVFNFNEYYPEAIVWAGQKSLTVFANSDVHASIYATYRHYSRPVTLVFSTGRSEDAIKQALNDRRTAAYFGDTIVGDQRFLTPIFLNSIEVENYQGTLKNQAEISIRVRNKSDLTFYLQKRQPSVGFTSQEKIVLPANKTVTINIEGTSVEVAQVKTLRLFYEVKNLITLKNESLHVNIDVPNK